MAKMGRPKKEINWHAFEACCQVLCTLPEIAGILDVSEDTLQRAVKKKFGRTFAVVYREKASFGRMSIRRKQYDIAMKGNVVMLIWLGKQWLGQKDKHEITDGDDSKDTELKYVPRESIVWNKPVKK